MPELPPFPVDDETLGLIEAALAGTPGPNGRTSIGELCELMSQLAGSDTTAVDEVTDSGIHIMRDPQYHPSDIIEALVAEVRRMRAVGADA